MEKQDLARVRTAVLLRGVTDSALLEHGLSLEQWEVAVAQAFELMADGRVTPGGRGRHAAIQTMTTLAVGLAASFAAYPAAVAYGRKRDPETDDGPAAVALEQTVTALVEGRGDHWLRWEGETSMTVRGARAHLIRRTRDRQIDVARRSYKCEMPYEEEALGVLLDMRADKADAPPASRSADCVRRAVRDALEQLPARDRPKVLRRVERACGMTKAEVASKWGLSEEALKREQSRLDVRLRVCRQAQVA